MLLPFLRFAPKPAWLALLAGCAGLLTGCEKPSGAVRLDFIGAANLTSSDRTAGPADTVAVAVFAQATGGADQTLTRLTLTVTATPLRRPFRYPAALASFRPQDLPASVTQILLDSALRPGTRELRFQTTLTARATTGTERWEFTATDTDGNTARRAFRLVVRRPDSLALVQAHSLLARPGRGPLARPLSLLALDSAQLLPAFAARPAAGIVDAQLTETAAGVRLSAFGGRATELRRTALNSAGFAAPTTPAAFRAAFEAAPLGTPPNVVSLLLANDDVLAYRTAGGQHGLLQVANLVRIPVTTLRLNVRTAK